MESVALKIMENRAKLGCVDVEDQKREDQSNTLALYEVERLTRTQLQIYLDTCRTKYTKALIEPGTPSQSILVFHITILQTVR